MIRKWMESVWFWPVVALVILTILTRGQILMAAGPLAKFLIPFFGGYVIYRIVKHKIKQTLMNNFQKTMNNFANAQGNMQGNAQRNVHRQMHQPSHFDQSQPVIEICPKCGEPKKAACPQCR